MNKPQLKLFTQFNKTIKGEIVFETEKLLEDFTNKYDRESKGIVEHSKDDDGAKIFIWITIWENENDLYNFFEKYSFLNLFEKTFINNEELIFSKKTEIKIETQPLNQEDLLVAFLVKTLFHYLIFGFIVGFNLFLWTYPTIQLFTGLICLTSLEIWITSNAKNKKFP